MCIRDRDIRSIYDQIMDGEKLDDLPDGEIFRRDVVYITDGIKQEMCIRDRLVSMSPISRPPSSETLNRTQASPFSETAAA